MGVKPPFLYDAVKTEGPRSPYRDFDPRAASRASFQSSRAPPRPKQTGPLVSFNQHPDSYLIVPYGNINATPMGPSVKKWIKWMRVVQLFLRSLEFLGACGLLVMMILIRNVDEMSGWIMRIVPGVAILHTIYAIYHLGRKPSGRTPASSASYMLFASFADCSILPFYAFGALVAQTRQAAWTTVLADQGLVPTFSHVVFLTAITCGGMHLTSLAISLYLAVTFRKITKLPPDMNPLEDNLTSRHKRSKSSISTMSTATTATANTKRLSTPLEAKRSSGAPYEDLSRPPTIPFFHTRTQSTSSFSTYKSTEPPTSRDGPAPNYDARSNLPSNRRYQPIPNPAGSNNRASMVDTSLKRSSFLPSTPPKRASYQEVPTSDRASMQSLKGPQMGKTTEGWYASDSLSKSRSRTPGAISPSKKAYTPLHQRHDSGDDISTFSNSTFTTPPHPNPLNSNPATPTPPKHGHRYNLSRDSPLSEITNSNSNNGNTQNGNGNRGPRRISGDITNLSHELISTHPSSLMAGRQPQPQSQTQSQNPHPHRQSPTRFTPASNINAQNNRYANDDDVSALSESAYSDDEDAITAQITRELTPAPLRSSELSIKSKYYGELKPGTPPIMIGGGAGRKVSGNDFAYAGGHGNGDLGNDGGRGKWGMGKGGEWKREVSGKVAEEGRGNGGGFGARFRKISGL